MRTVERKSHLWYTCAHECAHYIADETFGFRPEPPVVTSQMTAYVSQHPPRRRGMRGVRDRVYLYHDAIASLVGPVMSERLEDDPAGLDGDYRHVRTVMRDPLFPVSMDVLRAEAEHFVSTHLSDIERMADVTYRRVLGAGMVTR